MDIDDDFAEFINYVEDNLYLPVPRRFIRDQENPFERYTNLELVQRYRFTRVIFLDILLPMIYPQNVNSNRGLPIPQLIKLGIALRYFATGSYQRVCGDLVNIIQSSVSRVISEVSTKLARNLNKIIKFPRYGDGVIGCVDGTHIEIKSPGGLIAEVFRNKKGWMSLNGEVVAGPQQKILDIVIRWPGSAHDSRIFNNSSVHMKLERGDLHGIVLGDSAYAQTRYMFTSLLNPQNRMEQRYSPAHIRTRNVVERTFGIWKGRFRCLVGAIQLDLHNSIRVIAATAVLHNIAIEHRLQFVEQDFVPENHIPQVPAPNAVRGIAISNAFLNRHFA